MTLTNLSVQSIFDVVTMLVIVQEMHTWPKAPYSNSCSSKIWKFEGLPNLMTPNGTSLTYLASMAISTTLHLYFLICMKGVVSSYNQGSGSKMDLYLFIIIHYS